MAQKKGSFHFPFLFDFISFYSMGKYQFAGFMRRE